MKNTLLIITIFIFLGSCKSKADKAVNKLDDWFGGFDSVVIVNNTTKQYFKYTDTNVKEVAVESIIDQELNQQPNKQQIEIHDQNNQTQSNYEWESENSKILLNVFYTNPATTKGMRYMVTLIRK